MIPKLTRIEGIGAEHMGYIGVAEKNKNISFSIERVYWTYSTPNNVIRGHHAHKKLEQMIIAVSGEIQFDLINQRQEKFSFLLDHPSKILHIPPMHWRTIQFSKDAVLLCLASEKYKESDYIRNYDEFLKYRTGK